jgi:hypothetical protein
MSLAAWTAAGVAAPACVLALASAVALALGVLHRDPIWFPPVLTLSEAAGLDDEAEVVRLIERGADPNAPHGVAAGVLFDAAAWLTPIEAAVIAKNPSMIATLLSRGVTLDADEWNQLRCQADAEDVASMLDGHRPAGATTHCGGNQSAPGEVVN